MKHNHAHSRQIDINASTHWKCFAIIYYIKRENIIILDSCIVSCRTYAFVMDMHNRSHIDTILTGLDVNELMRVLGLNSTRAYPIQNTLF